VRITGLEPGKIYEYEVALDGERVWPEDSSDLPPPVIRTIEPDGELNLSFGSCRISVPHEPPFTLDTDAKGEGYERDALYALALRMMREPHESWPDALLLLGDQIYADEVSRGTLEFIRSRRDPEEPPGETVADFEEYTHLYYDAWKNPVIRWLLSTVPSAMIFDDHDVHDDWNTSQAWVEEMRGKPWWEERIVGAFMSYWIYQHLGNLSPTELEENEIFERVQSAEDPTRVLREFAYRADREIAGTRWSYHRDFGRVRLVMMTRGPDGCSRKATAPCSTTRSGPGSRTKPPATSTTSSSAARSPSSWPQASTTSRLGTKPSARAPGDAQRRG
jgi:phosphodiesterase/alkaline phosphatase D-like protein